MSLRIPNGYPPSDDSVCNGCGALNGLSRFFIPNTLYGLSVREACNIHDYMYHVGQTERDKFIADVTFIENMEVLIHEGSKWLRKLREMRARKYYFAVKVFGGPAFWANKGEQYGT